MTLPGVFAATTGIRDGNRLPSVPKFQISANATYSFEVKDGVDGHLTASFQHVGSRYTQPVTRKQPAHLSCTAFRSVSASRPTLRLRLT
ncbi:MAG: hypothetical protein IPO97_10000 [Sphingomonadales bacterium]|nr:hypothetical protein [Sphingomonadales bacterium]